MPEVFSSVAVRAAEAGGFSKFEPDACLINRYEPGARMSLAPGPERAGFRAADSFRFAGPAGGVSVWRQRTER